MHAASVHPEPGSNSLNMLYQGDLSISIISSLSCSTYFKELIIFKFKRIFGVFYILSLLFNFQGASLPTFWGAAWLLYQNLFPLSIPFLKFFQSFLSFLFKPSALLLQRLSYSLYSVSFASALAVSFVIISIHHPIVNYFFQHFLASIFWTTDTILALRFCA